LGEREPKKIKQRKKRIMTESKKRTKLICETKES